MLVLQQLCELVVTAQIANTEHRSCAGMVAAPVRFHRDTAAASGAAPVLPPPDALDALERIDDLSSLRELRCILLSVHCSTRLPERWTCVAFRAAGLRAKMKCVC